MTTLLDDGNTLTVIAKTNQPIEEELDISNFRVIYVDKDGVEKATKTRIGHRDGAVLQAHEMIGHGDDDPKNSNLRSIQASNIMYRILNIKINDKSPIQRTGNGENDGHNIPEGDLEKTKKLP
ncbi:MAG: hypothetical protein H6607_07365 [Flavobacteriales bacterium]|nr:hypothetical protein [Flavobacteriales bacterium]